MIKFCKTIFVFCLPIFSLTLSAETKAPVDIKYEPPAGWVKPFHLEYHPAKIDNESSVRYLLSDQQYDVSQKEMSNYLRITMQPVNENGLVHVAEIGISFNPDFEKLVWHDILVTRDGKTTSRLEPSKIKILNEDASKDKRQYNGRVKVLAILKDIRVNDIISYGYTITGTNPILGEKRFGRFSTSWGISLENLHLRLVTKKNAYIQFSKSDKRYKKASQDGLTEYTWDMKNTTAIAQEDRYPSWFSPYSFIDFTEYKSWKEVNQWALDLYTAKETSPELLNKIAQWEKQSSTEEDQIASALQFVQDEVRYFGIEVGQNTHQPFSPAEVFERRYGDCKDKTTLLITILHQMGIQAYPALVSSYGGKVLDEQVPSPGAFDHVIVNLDYKSQKYWLDGTVSHQRGGLKNIGFIDYEKALVVKKGTRSISQINRINRENPSVETREIFDIPDLQKATTLIVETIFRGLKADSIRYSIASNGPKILSENFLNFYSSIYPEIEIVDDINIKDDENKNEIIIYTKYKIKNWTERSGGKRYISVYATDMREYLATPKTLVRKHPFSVLNHVDLLYSQTIRSHKGKIITFDDKNIEKNTDYFSYHKKVERQGESVTVTHQYTPKINYVDAKNTAEYVSLVKNVKEQLGMNVVLQDTSGESKKSQQDKLRSLAKSLLKKK
ncbi:MAG: DUF3857 domain-containing transglutaminase family protein [Enterobacterales bacterium]|nr:DUF3857 domain-containing transglutaminase family protein [Enterobacterales bacterium]